jgi:urease accessory protein
MTSAPSDGILEFTRVAGRTALTRAQAHSPLTLLSPRRRGSDFAWAVCGTLGGGLVAGDEIGLNVHVRPGCSAVLGTQASTKIYRAMERRMCRQELHARVDDGAILIVAGDPVTCFAGAVYEQRQRFDLTESAALIAIDWITSGRQARGERWQMTSCRLRTDVFVQNRQVFRDALRFDADGLSSRMGKCDCWASVIMIGPRLAAAIEQTLQYVAGQPVVSGRELFYSAGPIPGGLLMRVAGASVEQVLQFFRARLPVLAELAGHDPWSGK